jgi:hypothetical protein
MRASSSAIVTLAALLLSPAAEAVDTKAAEADYQRLQRWQYTAQPAALTQPVTFTRDTATWTLQSGSVRLAEPIANGRITGLVFEGQGRFAMTIPDPVELAQLRRFSQRGDLRSIELPFTEMVFRISDGTLDSAFPSAPKGPFASNAIAENRHNHWLIDLDSDTDARVLAAMLNPGALQMMVGMKSADFGWMTYDYDSSRDEEIELIRWDRSYPEVWVSLARPEARAVNGRPTGEPVRPAQVTHLDVKADLTRSGMFAGSSGATRQRNINGHYSVTETIVSNFDGLAALRLEMLQTAHGVAARDESGAPLLVLRDHIGARSAAIDNKIYDPFLTVIFPEPLNRGQPRRVTFDYDLELSNYAPGNSWYPALPGFHDLYTARLELLVSKRNQVRAMGKLQSQSETDKGSVTVWAVDRPTKMITFSTAERFNEEKVEVAGAPTVISFGATTGLDPHARIHNAAADVVNSLQFYQWLFDDKLDVPQVYVTSITGGHGQAFDGFLHLSEFSYEEHPGATELFRAHEVAHEWWGHKIGWKTYRDQWLSESFAEYASMMFVQATVKGGDRLFAEILDSYDGIVQGNMAGGFSKFNRPWLIVRSAAYRARLGPIGVGYRASTGDVPYGYLLQTYYKGPLVVHMLRMLLFYKTQSDAVFLKILRDFVKENKGKDAGTADFQRIVERDAPGDWSFFFNAWVYGAGIPDVRWSFTTEPVEKGFKVTITAKRSGVVDDFTAVAPVRIELEGGRKGMVFIMMRGAEPAVATTIVPTRPRNVVFAPDHSLLANIRRE